MVTLDRDYGRTVLLNKIMVVSVSVSCRFLLNTHHHEETVPYRPCNIGDGNRTEFSSLAGKYDIKSEGLRYNSCSLLVRTDARPDFLEQQVASFMHSIDGGTERPSLADDLKYQVQWQP